MASIGGLIFLHTPPKHGEIIKPIRRILSVKVCLGCGIESPSLGKNKFCNALCRKKYRTLKRKKPLSVGKINVGLDEDIYTPPTHLGSFPHDLKQALEWAIYQNDINEESFCHDPQLAEYHDFVNDSFRERRMIRKISKFISSLEEV